MNCRRYIFPALVLCLSIPDVHGQQLPAWSNFRSFLYSYNPAAVSIFEEDDPGSNVLDLDLAYQQQWSDFTDAPTTLFLGGQYTVQPYNFAIGAKLIHDKFGPTSFTKIELQYAYQLKFDGWDDHFLSVGLGVSFTNFSVDGSKLNFENPDDPLALTESGSMSLLNGSIGVYYQVPLYFGASSKYVFGGISADQSLPSALEMTSRTGNKVNFERVIHANAFGGFRNYYSDTDLWEFIMLVRYVENIPLYRWGGIQISFLEQFLWVGGGLSSDWIFHPQIGIRVLDNLRLNYSTFFYLSNRFSTHTGLSHEIGISFRNYF